MKILLIEDSPEIINTISLTFKLSWDDVVLIYANNGKNGVEMAENESPDIIILDINLPDMDGFEVLRDIRFFCEVPVIILSVRDAEVDKVRGLEMGADDYITKPFSSLDLLARVKAVTRRTGMQRHDEQNIPPYTTEKLAINFATREVILSGERLHLTPTEYKLLHHMVRNEGRTITQQALQRSVWGNVEYIDPSTIKKYIYQLRSKLGDTANPPQIIINERGIGYKFVRPR
jgi:two-component system KDP operon response regulator KdpE